MIGDGGLGPIGQTTLWPQGGSPPYLRSAAEYLATVEQLRRLGLIDDATMLLWELRPSSRYPTLEFRIADVCTDVDDVVLYAGLVRSLIRTLGQRIGGGIPAPDLPAAVLGAARWRASRYGLEDALLSARTGALVPAAVAVQELWSELEPDLVRHGEHELVGQLLHELSRRGPSAARQRRAPVRTGSLLGVTEYAVELTARG